MRRRVLRCVWVFAFCCVVAVPSGRPVWAALTFAEIVYVATNNGTIHQFGARRDGTLTPLSPPVVQVAPPKFPVTFVLHPSHPFAYAATIYDESRKATIYPYRVLKNGTLVPIGAAEIHLKGAVSQILADPKGRFLYAVGDGGKVFTFRCLPSGRLATLPTNDFRYKTFDLGLEHALSEGNVTIEPSGRFAYSYYEEAGLDWNNYFLTVYALLPDGVLQKKYQEKDTPKVGDLRWDAAGKYAFYFNRDTRKNVFLRPPKGGEVSVAREQAILGSEQVRKDFDADGKLTVVERQAHGELLLMNSRRAVAVASGADYEMLVARIDPSGQIQVMSHVALPGMLSAQFGSYPRAAAAIAFGQKSRYAYAVCVKKTPSGYENMPPYYLVSVRLETAQHNANASRLVQTLSLGDDAVQTIAVKQ